MIKSKKFLLLILLAFPMVFMSCQKEGCTNPLATNYSAEAEKDDGSCVYPDAVTTGGAKIKVLNSDTSQPRVGVEVNICKGVVTEYYADVVASKVTNSEGIALFSDIEEGWYTLQVDGEVIDEEFPIMAGEVTDAVYEYN